MKLLLIMCPFLFGSFWFALLVNENLNGKLVSWICTSQPTVVSSDSLDKPFLTVAASLWRLTRQGRKTFPFSKKIC